MRANSDFPGSRRYLEVIKWVIVAILLLVAIIGNYYYCDSNQTLRCLVVLLIITIAGAVALITTKGKESIVFARDARTEIRKVIWPTCQETRHTTLIVGAVTAVMSMILWGIDSVLVRFVSFIISLRL